ncbi:flavin reductase [Eggerthellaceae bacterium 3-80]|nr:flavin reductase [bacterium D16-34]
MIDNAAFRTISYGLFIISSRFGDTYAGCVANTFQQVTSSPLQVSVTLNKENYTTQVIQQSGRFCASVLSEQAPMELIGRFGFHTSSELNKFDGISWDQDEAGFPYVSECCVAWFSVRVVQTLDVGTHMIFVGEVESALPIDAQPPMTYAYYHQVKGGKTPARASSFLPTEAQSDTGKTNGAIDTQAANSEFAGGGGKGRYAWQCQVCGHIEYVDELPEDFVCPVCGVGREMFVRIEL